MNDEKIIKSVKSLLKKFDINVKHIIRNSDNTREDVEQEAYIVFIEFETQIRDNTNIFINELRKRCLGFNKYGVRVESKDRWERLNKYESDMLSDVSNLYYEIKEGVTCSILDIQNIIGKAKLKFLLDYYNLGSKEMSLREGISEANLRKRVSNTLKFIREHYKEVTNGS